MELILDFIYIYIGIFSIYFFILGLRSLNAARFKREERVGEMADKSLLCVIIYSHNNYDSLKNMLNQLKHQDYPVGKYIIQVILDNCNDHSEELITETENLRVLNLNDGVTVGKDQAVSILLENLRQDTFIDGYVFLDTDRYIEQDFLNNANAALNVAPVVVGQTIVLENGNLSFGDKIKITYQKYQNNFVRKARALMGFADKIDSSVFCIKKEFAERVDALDLKDINTELKYSVLIASLGYPCRYVPYLKSYVKAFNFELHRPSLSYRISLFKQCFTKIFTFNFKFSEYIWSLIAPSGLVAVTLSICYLLLSAKYYFLFNFIFVFTVFSLLILGFAISLLKADLYAKDFLYLVLYPLYSILHILDNLPPYRFVKKYFLHEGSNKKNVQKYTVKVMATNGKANMPCKLDLISENGMAKVVFTFKKKKFTSSKQIRMVEALNELTSKLNDYGFHLKICYCCEYFSSIVDGSKNMIHGECSYEFAGRKPGETLTTLLWNSCSACKPKKIRSVIEDIRLNQED